MRAKDSQILQQNQMLMGGQTINLRARQLVYVLASLMDKDQPTATIRVSAKEFLSFVNTNSKETWSDVYRLTTDIFDHLNENPILLRKPKSKDFVKINWLSSLGVVKGELQARFSADIADYFLYKQGLPYTRLIWDLRGYKSNFTARILDLLQRNHIKSSGKTEVVFEEDLDELKLFFGVHDKYPRFYDFEKRVLEVTRAELDENDTAPYWFEYEKVKAGRVIKAIRFTVYVRPKVLLAMVPELKLIGKTADGQMSIFSGGQEGKLTESSRVIVGRLMAADIAEDFALKVVSAFAETQALAYLYLIEYGVNRNLAFNLVGEYCSFGELEGFEDAYVEYALKLTEAARIRRIMEVKSGKSNKRTTPDHLRGALAKKVFVDRQHFSAFMEKLPAIRAKRGEVIADSTSSAPASAPEKVDRDAMTKLQGTRRSASGPQQLGDILKGKV